MVKVKENVFLIYFKEVTFRPQVNELIERVRDIHENFDCLHGFINL